ncbi:hypothetical protein D8864_09355 [Streptococcus oralis]|nr:hypothetical protein D8864_09355 [Streptococcus oralis]
MWKSLRTCAGCASSCWGHFRKLWTVGRSNWSAILIYTFDCDWIWFSDKLLVWVERYSSIWRNRISSLTWNRLLFASIFENWLNCFINWNQWGATLEAWGTCLWNTLRTCARCISAGWGYLSHCWSISRSNLCTVLIYAFDCDWIWVSDKLFVWGEGHCTVWYNRVSSLTWNSLLFATIFEGWLDCFIDWNQWVTTLEAWSTCLRNTLRACAGCASSCWCYLGHCWSISRSDWSSILIYPSNRYWSWSSNILLIRRKGDRTIWIDAVFTHTWNCFR